MGVFNWLHLTDLHCGQKGDRHLWPTIRQAFFEDLPKLRDLCGPWQAVLFSGDFVQTGAAAEFDELEKQVFTPLWSQFAKIGCDPILLAVPGNHDLQWPDGKSLRAALTMLKRPGMFSDDVAEEFWNDPKSEYRRVIDKAFANYSAWWNKRSHAANQEIQRGLLPGDFSTTILTDDGQHRIGIVGLNTTFLQLDAADYEGRLSCDVRQMHAACPPDGPDWAEEHDVRILMTHQGPKWLDPHSRDNAYVEIGSAGRFAVHLFGHMHEECIRSVSSGGGPTRRFWQGPSLFGMEYYGDRKHETRVHGYSAGSVQFDGDRICLRHWPRIAKRDAGGWHVVPDHDHCRLDDDDGTFAETLSMQSAVESRPRSDDLESQTAQLLAAYHEKVQRDWGDRWSREDD